MSESKSTLARETKMKMHIKKLEKDVELWKQSTTKKEAELERAIVEKVELTSLNDQLQLEKAAMEKAASEGQVDKSTRMEVSTKLVPAGPSNGQSFEALQAEIRERVADNEVLAGELAFFKEECDKLRRQVSYVVQSKMDGTQTELPLTLPVTTEGAAQVNGDVEQLRQEATKMRAEIAPLNEEIAALLGRLDHLLRAMWEQEVRSPPSFSLLRAYELQRSVVLTMYDLRSGVKLTEIHFTGFGVWLTSFPISKTCYAR